MFLRLFRVKTLRVAKEVTKDHKEGLVVCRWSEASRILGGPCPQERHWDSSHFVVKEVIQVVWLPRLWVGWNPSSRRELGG
jgi:hypothetical protein